MAGVLRSGLECCKSEFMNEARYHQLLILSFLALAAMTALWYTSESGKRGSLSQSEYEQALQAEIMSKIEEFYDGPVDRTTLLNGSLQGMAASLGDPYTVVDPPAEAMEAREHLDGQFGGIGVTIRPQASGFLDITEVHDGGPASTAGVRIGDTIVAVDGLTLLGVSREEAGRRIKGAVDTQVQLMIRRQKAEGSEEFLELPITVTRGIIVSPSVRGVRVLPGTSIGYMRLDSFSKLAFTHFKEAYLELEAQGIKGLVFDLRGNGGGVVTAATDIADAFTEQKDITILSTRSSDEARERQIRLGVQGAMSANIDYTTQDAELLVKVPTVVLTDRASASASEVLAGFLQDHGIAAIIGERTFGKGVVQAPIRVVTDPNYRLKVTIASYYTPLGNRLMRPSQSSAGGIQPDLEIPLTDAEFRDLSIRLNMQMQKRPLHPDSIDGDQQRQAWNARDRHLDAAIAWLGGVSHSVPLANQ